MAEIVVASGMNACRSGYPVMPTREGRRPSSSIARSSDRASGYGPAGSAESPATANTSVMPRPSMRSSTAARCAGPVSSRAARCGTTWWPSPRTRAATSRVASTPFFGEDVTVTVVPSGRFPTCSTTPRRGSTSKRAFSRCRWSVRVVSLISTATSSYADARTSRLGMLLVGSRKGFCTTTASCGPCWVCTTSSVPYSW